MYRRRISVVQAADQKRDERKRESMKKVGTQKIRANGQAPRPLRVTFNHSTAKAVAIAGSFNGWRPESAPMIQMGNGRWLKELVLPPGAYEYLIVVDGKWVPAPSAKQTVPNPFGA